MVFEEETKVEEERKSLKDYVIEYAWVIIAGLFLLFFKGRLGVSEVDKAFLYAASFFLLCFFAKLAWAAWKNSTPKIVFNYGHSTTDGEIITAGNFGIMRPAIKAFGMYFKLRGAYVAPLDALYKAGPNILINAKMEKVELDEMPLEVRSVIRELRIPPPYFLGFADEEQYDIVFEGDEELRKITGIPKPSVSYLIDEIKKLNKQVAMRERVMDGDIHFIEKFVSGASRIHARAKGDIFEMIKKALTEEGE